MSANALVLKSPEWESKIELIRRTVAKGATNDEMDIFLHQCRKTGLDPLAKQIYFQKRQNKKTGESQMTIITGIDGYRLVAQRTGQYAGNDDPVFDDEAKPRKATVTVYRIVGGIRCPFTASARWEQYYPGDYLGFMWNKMPHLMLGKCAEALALRKAFPAELSGVYTAEEMHQAGAESPAKAADGQDTAPCDDCGKPVDVFEHEGKAYSIGKVMARSQARFDGATLCMPCQFRREGKALTEVATATKETPTKAASGGVEGIEVLAPPKDPDFEDRGGQFYLQGTVASVGKPKETASGGASLSVKMKDGTWVSSFHKSQHGQLLASAGKMLCCDVEQVVKGDKVFWNIGHIQRLGNVLFDDEGNPVPFGKQEPLEVTDADRPF